MLICQWTARQLVWPVVHGRVLVQQLHAYLYPINSILAWHWMYSPYGLWAQAMTLWTGNSEQVHGMNESSSWEDQVYYLEDTERHNVLLQPKKISSSGVPPWGLGIPRCIQYQDNTSVSETVTSSPWTFHCGIPSRTLYILFQTTTCNEETSFHIQYSKALHCSRRPYTRTKTTTTASTNYHWWKRRMESKGDLGQSLVQKEVPVPGEMEGI